MNHKNIIQSCKNAILRVKEILEHDKLQQKNNYENYVVWSLLTINKGIVRKLWIKIMAKVALNISETDNSALKGLLKYPP